MRPSLAGLAFTNFLSLSLGETVLGVKARDRAGNDCNWVVLVTTLDGFMDGWNGLGSH